MWSKQEYHLNYRIGLRVVTYALKKTIKIEYRFIEMIDAPRILH